MMFLERLLSSVVLLLAFFGLLTLRSNGGLILFFILGSFILCACVKELTEILKKIDIETSVIVNAIISVCIFISFILPAFFKQKLIQEKDILLVVIATCSIYSWLIMIFKKDRRKALKQIVGIGISTFLLTIPLSFISLIYVIGYGEDYEGIQLLLFLVLVTKSGDMGAYVIGVLTANFGNGNHKIVPTISPKKSWEGTVGGLIASVTVSIILGNTIKIHIFDNFFIYGIIGVVLFIGGFTGDLAESALKRCSGIKDASTTIPGIGGVLDLVDSLIINAPIFYIIIKGSI